MKKTEWVKYANEIFIDINDKDYLAIEEVWKDLNKKIKFLKRIKTDGVSCSDFCFNSSKHVLREDVPVSETTNFASEYKVSNK